MSIPPGGRCSLPAPQGTLAVLDKLRRLPSSKDFTEAQLTKRAELLSNETMLKETIFGDILGSSKDSIDQAMREAGQFPKGKSSFTELEAMKARERAQRRFATVRSLPMKLVLTRIGQGGSSKGKTAMFANGKAGAAYASYMKFPFGAFHAAVKVGNVLLEWDDSSLVVPECTPVTPVFQANLDRYSYWNRFTSRYEPHFSETLGEDLDYNNQVEVMLIISQEKKDLIDTLVQEIVKYNTRHTYSLRDCNCQHFVLNIMRILRVFELPKFAGRLKRYFDTLCSGKQVNVQRDFKTHTELDKYVQRRLPALDPNEVDYLCCAYTEFHQESMKEDSKWQCPIRGCQMAALHELVDENRLMQYKIT